MIDTDLLRKFIAYVRKIKPELTDESEKELLDYYLEMRGSVSGENGIKSIPISARQLEGLVRMSEACAKIRLSDTIDIQDAKNSINLMDYCLKTIAMDGETGTVDIDRITTGVTSSKRNKISIIKKIISEFEGKIGKNIPIQDITNEAAKYKINSDDVESAIESLKKAGDLMESRRGFIQRI